MSKIRINELARELEVKPNVILELLPELGVSEKKTHSSSLDDEVALEVRRRLGGAVPENGAGHAPAAESSSEAAQPAIEPAQPPAPEPAPVAQPPVVKTEPAPVEAKKETIEEPPPQPRAHPVRPPLASTTSPAAPPAQPSTPGPAAQPSASAPARGVTIPAKPVPSPRPGQILSGPRQPLPPGMGEAPKAPPAVAIPGTPRPAPVPSIPAPRPAARPGAPPAAQSAPGGQPVGGGSPLRPPAKPNLAGQPAARPVVPPRPDLVAKLTQRPAAPGVPAQPRPGMPANRPASPMPGRPIYQGPVRPGQPLSRGPGQAPGGPGRGPGGRGRGMHPTAGPLRAEPATVPTETGRRHATKPGARTDRRREEEEGRLRPVARRAEAFEPPPVDREITIAEGITVKELSEKLGVKANLVIKRLFEKKIFATINQTLDVKLAEEVSRDFGASTNKVSYEQETRQEIEETEVEQDREKRPPVVTIMGHVDHGKTSLLDAIRSANVAASEAGGITQHIGAYHVEKNGRKIVFIDTPGHEAFTRMRARGAKVTDIVVLVVAADDGVMPQTLEAIDHAKAAQVPIIVAINKIDKPDAQPERIKQQLADRGLLSEDWGGDTVMVPVSAKAKTNLDLLLEMILLVADLQDLKANPARPAMGTVLEAKLDRGRGPVATVLVRNGTLRVGDYFICGSVFGRVRAMFDDRGQPVREVPPSMPAEVLGLDSLPDVGDNFQVVTDTAKAKQIVIYRESKAREAAMSKTNRITLDQLHDQLKEGETKELNIILKTDVGGTAEVLTDTLQKLSTDKVKIRVLHSGVGAITETDVLLASASNAIIVGFNVRPERTAQAVAEQEKVDIRLHTIIYELSDEIKRAMSGMLEPVFKEVYKGRAQVREVFRISKVGTVAGCMVQDGSITRDSEVRLLRDNVVIYTGKVLGLKRFKNDASEVKAGFECGISLANFNDIKPGDVIEAFVTERVASEALV
ncbi:MAG TPA: translation initiation factor IF-2 [Bryobacteraceae bacterium]|jgi:translation initiation factor IF-2|nr:translation initiation factor IF-2 [Bryobacteraceae bacterium]